MLPELRRILDTAFDHMHGDPDRWHCQCPSCQFFRRFRLKMQADEARQQHPTIEEMPDIYHALLVAWLFEPVPDLLREMIREEIQRN